MDDARDVVVAFLKFSLCFLYIAPVLIASFRKHKNLLAISALNVLLGFTVLGWIAALIWSLTENTETKK